MKNIYKYFSLVFLLIFFVSCEDDESQRIPDTEKAFNFRITFPDPALTVFNFTDLSTAKIQYNVYSDALENIKSVSVMYSYVNANTSIATDPVEIRNYTAGSFSNGQIIAEQITASELVADLGITLGDLNGGDVFNFNVFVTDNKDRVYPSETVNGNLNVTPNILNAAASTSFTTSFSALVGCPISAAFAGNYDLEIISDEQGDAFNGDAFVMTPGEVTVTNNGPIFRTFSFKYYSGSTYNFDVNFNFTLLCGQLVVPKTASGVGCGGPGLNWVGTGTSTYDPADDSELVFEINNNVDSGCGLTPGIIQFRLVKK